MATHKSFHRVHVRAIQMFAPHDLTRVHTSKHTRTKQHPPPRFIINSKGSLFPAQTESPKCFRTHHKLSLNSARHSQMHTRTTPSPIAPSKCTKISFPYDYLQNQTITMTKPLCTKIHVSSHNHSPLHSTSKGRTNNQTKVPFDL